jgi:hypothetical protein
MCAALLSESVFVYALLGVALLVRIKLYEKVDFLFNSKAICALGIDVSSPATASQLQ